MAFPTSPSDNNTTIVNGKKYIYNLANNSWKVVANTILDSFARTQSNSAFATANSAGVYANSAFATANIASDSAAGSYANSAFLQANTPSYTANSAGLYANAAFNKANNSTDLWVRTQSNSAFTAANSSGDYANSAFLQANTPSYTANSASGYANGAFTAANTADVKAINSGIYANAAFAIANNVIAAAGYANGAFRAANSAGTFANLAFAAANSATSAAASAQDSFARQTANAAFLQANNALSYNTSIANSVTSIQVGGAAPTAASTWKTYTIVQALDAILFPTLGPTYTLPTLSFSPSVSGTYEIGVSINQSMTLTGIKNDAGPFTQLRFTRDGSQISACTNPTRSTTSNVASQFGYDDPNNQNYSYTASYTDTFTIIGGTTTWAGDGNYSAGVAKLNNKGGTDSNTAAVLSTTNPQAEQNYFSGGSTSTTGIYPYFWGVSSSQPTGASIASAIAAGTTNKVVSDSSGSISITWNASGQYVWFAVPASYSTKTSWYNTALNNGSIGSGQFILGPVTQNVTSPSSYWTGVSYKIYISGFATTTSGSITLS
jgi:hypothetical protein